MSAKVLEHFWQYFVIQIPFLICAFWVIPRKWKEITSSLRKKGNKKTWMWTAIFFILRLILAFSIKSEAKEKTLETFNHSPVLFFILACLIAPITEECFFCYLIFENFNKKKWTPYIFSFFSFILMHSTYFSFSWKGFGELFLGYWLITWLFIYVYRKSNWNLIFPIVFHFINNFTVFLHLLTL